jgi:hypothetical protein
MVSNFFKDIPKNHLTKHSFYSTILINKKMKTETK